MTKKAEERPRATLRLLTLLCAFAVAFDLAFDVPPVACAEHRSPRRHGLAPVWREARQDAEAFLYRP
ncbi:hypothetical protein, partial [Nevskia soli]|uniref:hypothetical protein n=1 Tax=Nevskia soli TaxID=418856 RepID=UPI001B803426